MRLEFKAILWHTPKMEFYSYNFKIWCIIILKVAADVVLTLTQVKATYFINSCYIIWTIFFLTKPPAYKSYFYLWQNIFRQRLLIILCKLFKHSVKVNELLKTVSFSLSGGKIQKKLFQECKKNEETFWGNNWDTNSRLEGWHESWA